jgi:hypothetical protein
MYIDDFIWLPQIIDKLEIKHRVTQDEVEEIFSIDLNTDSLSRVIVEAKMYIRRADKQTQADT